MGAHNRDRRAAMARAGALACATAGPLITATVILQADALGGVVKVPGDAVTYMAFTALLLGCVELPLVLWLARRLPWPGLAAVAGGLTALTVAIAGLAPAVPVFASAMLLAGVLGGPLLALPRALVSPGLFAWWHAAALAGLTAAALLATARADAPGSALAIAGVAAAVLGLAAICVPRPAASPDGTGGRLRDAFSAARPSLAAYATAGMAVAITVQAGLHLLLFRWTLVGSAPIARLAWAALAALVLVVLARRLNRSARTVPWLLLAAATAPVLVATAPRAWLLPLGFTVALAAATLAAATLDTAVLGPAPSVLRSALAGLTTAVAILSGLAGIGAMALLASLTSDANALTLMALPLAAGALLSLRVPVPPDEMTPFLEVRALTAGAGPSVDLCLHEGEAVALFGPGARTVLAAIAGHRPPVGGSVVLDGTDITTMPAAQRTALGLTHLIGATPPKEDCTVRSRLHAHANHVGRADPGTTTATVLEIFPPLRDQADNPVSTLAEPELRLLGLAEALITRPRLLLIDGLSPGLDPVAAEVLAAAVRRMLAGGTAVLLAEPVIPLALAVADRAHVLRRGRSAADLRVPAPDQVHRLLHRGGRRS